LRYIVEVTAISSQKREGKRKKEKRKPICNQEKAQQGV
jgi:hypothetical protein